MAKPLAKKVVAQQLRDQGFKVYPIRLTGVDLIVVKDGKPSLVACADDQGEPSPLLSELRKAGLDVRVEGASANFRKGGYRLTKSLSIRPENQPCIEKLERMLRNSTPPRTLSDWVAEQAYQYVSGFVQG